jgi:hypothetical protein
MKTVIQSQGIAGLLLHQVRASCPSCGKDEVHYFKDLESWKYTNDEAVKLFKDEFVQMYCGNGECMTIFAVKPAAISVHWELYTRVEADEEEEEC